ncbi:hypothetical protein F7725_006413 [Dissostichus mawsoni]|uniref:G-protein coupled receptors family 1 profile domain-containing protein n=1 Tax=Dissostichus mawsoni TaxID=36200 RepID=A0A7J5XUI8_DISMA|nr:hypothetical protein F7725_006413 [Dissostichus mawsoni]
MGDYNKYLQFTSVRLEEVPSLFSLCRILPPQNGEQTLDLDVLIVEGLKVTPQSSVPAFILLLLIYIFIMVSNIGLVVLISMERSLHQPMYLLFCNMSINDVFGASTIVPRILSDVFIPMSQRFMSYDECVLQAFCAHFHACIAHTVLIIMAFDRYMAICKPLRYAAIMTHRMVLGLSVVMLTYLRIAMVCLRSKNKALNSKALQTCATHLAAYAILLFSGCIIIILHRFPHLSDHRKLASIIIHVVPPAMNAIIYGLQIKAVETASLLITRLSAGFSICRMENLTGDLDIILFEGLKVTPQSSMPAFILLLLIYIFIMVSNISLVVLISTERSLHQPMYLLFCNMSINDAFGASTIIPRLLSDAFTPISERSINYIDCVVQAFASHFHAGTSHSVLMIMAFDRYVAICNPLRYATIMTLRMVVRLSAGAWLALHLRGHPDGAEHPSVSLPAVIVNPFCDNASLFKLSCESLLYNHIYGLGSAVVILGSSMCSVTLTYLRIALVCLTGKNKTLNSKALQTCGTHLAVYVIMLTMSFTPMIIHRLPEWADSGKVASILFFVIPPAMNPVIYGLQCKELRLKIFSVFHRNRVKDGKSFHK